MNSDNTNINSMIWNDVLSLIENDINKPTFDTWFQGTELVSYFGNNVIIKVQNSFAKNMLENNYFKVIKHHLESSLNQSLNIQFVTPQEKDKAIDLLMQQKGYADTSSKTGMESDLLFNNTVNVPKNNYKEDIPSYESNGLNPKYTFDTFVVGNSNRMTHAACVGVADNIASNASSRIYNPLFIYGGAGLGKTHLMHAIGNHILMHKPNTKIVYVSSEKFMNELIEAIKDGTNKEFRNRYRNVDVLLIDDIQFLSKKESTQEEFFHTFNELYEADKQIILSSDRPPNEIPKLEERLRTRFSMGLPTDIQPPDFETRIAILRKKAQEVNLKITEEILEYIAENVRSNIRELEGVLVRLSAYSSISNREIDLELTQECLKSLITPHEKVVITGELIQQKVADYYQIRIDDLKAQKRTKNFAYPRQIAMFLCRDMTDLSLPKIGELFGGRDHTTVIHACEKISLELKTDHNLQTAVQKIKTSLTED